jgi:hypothetical protein
MRRMLLIGLFWGAAVHAAGQAPPAGTDAPPEMQVPPPRSVPPADPDEVPPELRVAPQEGDAPSPEVTIKRDAKGTREEYAINGRVYMVKVIPAVGPPYYLVDPTGQGEFSQQINDIKNPPPVPRWVLLRW